MKRILFALVLLTTLMLAGCSLFRKKNITKNEGQISMTTLCKGGYCNIQPVDTLIILENNGELHILRPHYITNTHRDFIPTLEIEGDTLFVSDTYTHLCYCLSEFETEYSVAYIPYGKYVLIFGFRNAEALQEFRNEYPDRELSFPVIEIDFHPNMQPIVIRERREENQPDAERIYTVSDSMPEFPGGSNALFEYIVAHRMTPDTTPSCRRALVQFVVERDGSLSNIEVVRTCGNEELDNDAVSIVANMPQWTPGKVRGEPVRVRYTIPVSYRMN